MAILHPPGGPRGRVGRPSAVIRSTLLRAAGIATLWSRGSGARTRSARWSPRAPPAWRPALHHPRDQLPLAPRPDAGLHRDGVVGRPLLRVLGLRRADAGGARLVACPDRPLATASARYGAPGD